MATISDEEGSKGGTRSVALVGIVSAVLLIVGLLFGMGVVGGQKVAPPPSKTESPSGSQNQ